MATFDIEADPAQDALDLIESRICSKTESRRHQADLLITQARESDEALRQLYGQRMSLSSTCGVIGRSSPDPKPGCAAIRQQDEWACPRCKCAWDARDDDAPDCQGE